MSSEKMMTRSQSKESAPRARNKLGGKSNTSSMVSSPKKGKVNSKPGTTTPKKYFNTLKKKSQSNWNGTEQATTDIVLTDTSPSFNYLKLQKLYSDIQELIKSDTFVVDADKVNPPVRIDTIKYFYKIDKNFPDLLFDLYSQKNNRGSSTSHPKTHIADLSLDNLDIILGYKEPILHYKWDGTYIPFLTEIEKKYNFKTLDPTATGPILRSHTKQIQSQAISSLKST